MYLGRCPKVSRLMTIACGMANFKLFGNDDGRRRNALVVTVDVVNLPHRLTNPTTGLSQ
jgi:hypothetical protein